MELKIEEGYLKIEHLVGAVGRLVFVKGTLGDDGLDPSGPHIVTPAELDQFVEAYPQFDVNVSMSLQKIMAGITNVSQCYARFPVCSINGNGTSGVLALGGGGTPTFVPRNPHLLFSGDDAGIYVDITPIHDYAFRSFYGD